MIHCQTLRKTSDLVESHDENEGERRVSFGLIYVDGLEPKAERINC